MTALLASRAAPLTHTRHAVQQPRSACRPACLGASCQPLLQKRRSSIASLQDKAPLRVRCRPTVQVGHPQQLLESHTGC